MYAYNEMYMLDSQCHYCFLNVKPQRNRYPVTLRFDITINILYGPYPKYLS